MSNMEEIYRIPCSQLNPASVYFKKNRFCDWVVVWVDLARLISAWEKSPRALVLPPANTWDKRRYDIYRKGMENTRIPYTVQNVMTYGTHIGRLPMPRISYGWEHHANVFTLGFVNGRHRTRVLESLGAEAMPVQITEEEARLLSEHMPPPASFVPESFMEAI